MPVKKWRRFAEIVLFFVLLAAMVFPFSVRTADATEALDGDRILSLTGGDRFSLALRADGTVVAWGGNNPGKDVPADLSDVKAISGGYTHALALKEDGSVVAWGDNMQGSQYTGQAEVPEEALSGVTAIAAGYYHSLALKEDGSVVAWGSNLAPRNAANLVFAGQATVPDAAKSGVVAIAAGGYHSLALKDDGSVVAWGFDISDQASVPDAAKSGVKAIAAGREHSLALKEDGSVITWGFSSQGLGGVPIAARSGVVSIAAGRYSSLALKADGTVVTWGEMRSAPAEAQSGVVAIATNYEAALALKADGSVIAWDRGGNLLDVPGSAQLGGLTIQEGSLSPEFSPEITEYTFENLGVRLANVNLTVLPEDTQYTALYINGELQVGGSAVQVPLTGASTVIEIRVEPYLKPGRTYRITVLQDATPPTVKFGTNGNATPAKTAATIVTVTDEESGVQDDSLEYVWSQEKDTVPSEGWDAFTNDGAVMKNSGDGEWYLHIRAEDKAGNLVHAVTDKFVLDNTKPVIAIKGDNPLTIEAPGTFKEPEVTATDKQDGDITGRINVSGSVDAESLGTYTLVYTVSDTAGNIAAETLTVHVVDTTAPVIELEGDTELSIPHGSTYDEPGYSATDAYDGDLTGSVTVTGDVDTSQVGEYVLTYEVEDSSGNKASVTRKVTVVDDKAPAVAFGTNGSPAPAKTAKSTVTVTDGDGESGVDETSLEYAWSQSKTEPSEGWLPFANGAELTKSSGDGEWYLHIRARDKERNLVHAVSGAFLLDNTAPVITLNGSNPMNIPQGGTYAEPGATATDAIDGTLTPTIAENKVDTTALGQYTVRYEVVDRAGNAASITRTVVVYDGDAPAIHLNGPNEMTIEVFSAFEDPGATAWDPQDGDITGRIVRTGSVDSSTLGTYWLYYDVSDTANNAAATVTRAVYVVDTQPPVLVLVGDSAIRIPHGSVFVDPGAEAEDAYDGDLTGSISASGAVDTSRVGEYVLTYTVTDSSGNTSSARRAVTVYDDKPPAVHFGANGNPTPAKTAQTTVTVTDGETAVDPASLKYAWSQHKDVMPDSGWTLFSSGAALTKNTGDGEWYLHIAAQDTAGNSVHAVSNAFVLDNTPPVIELLGEAVINLTAGSSFADPGAKATDGYDGDISDRIVVTGTVDTSRTGEYVLRYTVEDTAGNAAAEATRKVRVVPPVSTQVPSNPANKPVQANPQADPESAKPSNDNSVGRLDLSAIDKSQPSVMLELDPVDGTASVVLSALDLAELLGGNPDFRIELRTPFGGYQVPADLAALIPGLDGLLQEQQLTAEDIGFRIALTDRTGDRAIREALTRNLPGVRIIGAAVDYSVEIVDAGSGQAVGKADAFTRTIQRSIRLPEDLTELPARWGAFRYNETTGQLEFVPARAVQINGAWEVVIASGANGVYIVAENRVSFTDTNRHWGQPVIELAAAKGLVVGVGGGRFEPDRSVTRAEFAAMLVRALGRGASSGGHMPYGDVQPDAWYYAELAAAKELGLLDFAGGTLFEPNRVLTREEMASMLAALISLEGLTTGTDTVNPEQYRDIASANAAYLEDIRQVSALGIMIGTGNGAFSPKDETTRAQAAAMVIRTLRALGWIEAE